MCAIGASNESPTWAWSRDQVCSTAYLLAEKAAFEVIESFQRCVMYSVPDYIIYAEAEALLRDGWTP